jgi:multicomponent K+:H+ antiporter subunit A
VSLPLTLVIGFVHVIFGHDQPGDGFTAGVIVSLAVAYWYVIYGYQGVRQRLTWLRPGWLMGGGLLLALTGASIGAWLGDGFFAHVNMGEMMGVTLPPGVLFSTSLIFEAAIGLTVLGSVSFMLNTLGRPQDVPVTADAEETKPSPAGILPEPHAPAATSDAAPAAKS